MGEVGKSGLPEGCPPLTTYYVYLTEGCNLACQHCWLSPAFQRDGSTGGHLDYDLFALALEQGLPLELYRVKLTGGEPLLHPDFTRMLDLLREKELNLTIETNGTLLTESLARYFREKSTLKHISVSLDGARPETHDAFRGVEGSFDKACQAVRYMAQAGYRPQVIMSLHAGNVGEVEALVRLAKELGASSVKFNFIQPSGRGELMARRGQVLGIQRLVEMGRWVESELQKQTSLRLFYSWPVAFYSLKRLFSRWHNLSCAIFNVLGILPTGHLAMCGIGMHEPELVYGQLGRDDVATVWTTHPQLRALRRALPDQLEGICGVCLMRERCFGHCVAESYYLYHRLIAANWFCQKAETAGLFPTSRRADT